MDFINRAKKQPVMFEKNLWAYSSVGLPLYNDLLNVKSLIDDGDTPAQRENRKKYRTRADYITETSAAGGIHAGNAFAARTAWDAIWAGNDRRPHLLNYNNWDTGTSRWHRGGRDYVNVPNPDYYGWESEYVRARAPRHGPRVPATYRSRDYTFPEGYFRNRWLREHNTGLRDPQYFYQGWSGSPNRPNIWYNNDGVVIAKEKKIRESV